MIIRKPAQMSNAKSMNNNKRRREIQNLIYMLGSAVVLAFVIVVGLAYYCESSGDPLRSLLVSPKTLQKISSSDKSEKTAPYVFNDIEFLQADLYGKRWGHYTVTLDKYTAFYKKIASLRSLQNVANDLAQSFEQSTPSTLTIHFHSSDNETSFQRVQFLYHEDVFRVLLRPAIAKGGVEEEWVYFRYPGIYQMALEFFSPNAQQT